MTPHPSPKIRDSSVKERKPPRIHSGKKRAGRAQLAKIEAICAEMGEALPEPMPETRWAAHSTINNLLRRRETAERMKRRAEQQGADPAQ